MSTDLVTIDHETGEVFGERGLGPLALTVDETVAFLAKVQEAKERVLHEGKGRDYWRIPGTGDKPSLLKPGAEKLLHFFGYRVTAMTRTETQTEPVFGCAYECRIENRNGQIVGVCEGWCDAAEAGRKGAPRNTIMKMAQKRAMVGAVLNACAASSLFTQDVEDYQMPGDSQSPARPADGVDPPASGRTDGGVARTRTAARAVSSPAAPSPSDHQGPATETRPVAGPSPLEVTHPDHRLHRLWLALDHYGIEWRKENWNRAIEALKASGITEVGALEDHETAMRANEIIRKAFGVKVAAPQAEPYEPASPLAAASFTKEVDGTLTAMYVIPSSKGDGTTYNVHLSNAGRDVCECPARKACRHLGEAETLLGQDAEQDPLVRKAFAVRLGLAEPEPPEAA